MHNFVQADRMMLANMYTKLCTRQVTSVRDSYNKVYIAGVGKALGQRVLTNKDLEQMVDTNDAWIKSRTGIEERRIVGPSQATSDLATEAALQALQRAGLQGSDLDLIIVATVTPDMLFPSTSCLVQANLGANKAAAMDLSAACSGFAYGLSVASQFIKTGTYRNALVVGAEVLSSITNYNDRNTCILFGDGAGAVVLDSETGVGEIKGFCLGADGQGSEVLKLPAGGSRLPASMSTIATHKHFIFMNGQEVFKFAVKIMEEATLGALQDAGMQLENLDWLIPHQANIRIINSAARRLKMPLEKVIVNVQKYGNMSAASIPVALCEAVEANVMKPGDQMVMVGFGGGLTWGAVAIEW